MSTELPPVAPEVLAEAVESLTARLRKKLDDATASCAARAIREADGSVTFRFGEDALVTLRPGPGGTVTEAEQATCSCLLAPRCLHRAAALGASPLADAAPPPMPEPESVSESATAAEPAEPTESAEPAEPAEPAPALTEAQLRAAAALWRAAAEALAAGVTAGGAVVQAELLRAAHTARLAGLPRAEAAALRVVRGLRAARERRAAQRLGNLTCAAGEHLLVREARPDAPLLRLLPAHPHPELPHTENLRRIASYPGLRMRVLGRPDLDRAATLRPLAVGPVPGAEYTLRLPEEWLGRADLGYDRLQGMHFPPQAAAPEPAPAADGPDPLADSPLWRVRRLLETGVAGGRRAVAEAARGTASLASASYGPLRRAGLTAAADLAAALAAEADRRPRDAFGRLADPSPDGYAWAWLAAATHLGAAERSLVAASWAAIPQGVSAIPSAR